MEPAKIELVEYYGQQIALRHNTNEYELLQTNPKTAIYRRGYNFYLAVRFDRDFDLEKDVLKVEFKFGSRTKKDITRITLVLRPKESLPKDLYVWGLALDRVDPKYVMVKVHIPANAPVGVWNCSVRTNIKDSPKIFHNYPVPEDFYILFNPWSTEDDVYMKNEEERKEYILNDTGKIWLGTWWKPEGRDWIFGQFDDIALRTAVLLLDKSGLSPDERGNAALVARAISAIFNSDESGPLVAKWDGNYSDGTSPYSWTGSRAILEQYYSSGRAPVKYGLYWVFSAITVTVCRALGIPCRSTTIYVSTQGSKNIIRSYDTSGNLIDDDQSNESFWNYHVWNDVWLARPNLPDGFGGWQIIDATPQRRSEGIHHCGPASLKAVRQGLTGYSYDTEFMVAKLNADVRRFVIDDDSDLGESLLPKSRYQSGRRIVTKALRPNDEGWEDITSSYKSPRETRSTDSDVSFDIVIDSVPLGDTLNFTVKVHNKSSTATNILYVLTARSAYYTGKIVEEIERLEETVTVGPEQVRPLKLSIPSSKYLSKLVDQGFIKLNAFCEVKGTGQRWAEEEDFIFTKPAAMTISTGAYYKVGDTIDVNVSFKNPLNVTLTNCFYTVEGPGDRIPSAVSHPDVQPLDEVKFSASLSSGKRIGTRRIVVSFTSRQLYQVTESAVVNVQKAIDLR